MGPSTGAAAAAASGSSTAAAAGPSNPNFHFGGDAEDDADEGADADENGEDGEDREGEEGEGDGDGAPGGGDREDDLESAFQMLDLARTILATEVADVGREIDKDRAEGGGKKVDELEGVRRKRQEKLAEVHRLLGDVATESGALFIDLSCQGPAPSKKADPRARARAEQFENAVGEYTSALSILSPLLPAYDRSLSELHMLTALALEFVPNATSRAVLHAEKAKGVLVLKLAELEKVPEGERDERTRREIDDIKGLMGDVDMKVRLLASLSPFPLALEMETKMSAPLACLLALVCRLKTSARSLPRLPHLPPTRRSKPSSASPRPRWPRQPPRAQSTT